MRSYMPPFVAALALAFAVASARAADAAPSVTYNATGGVVTGGWVTQRTSEFGRLIQGRPYVPPDVGGIDITDTAKVKAGASEFDALLKRSVTRRAVEKAGAAALRALPVVGNGLLLWDLWNEVRVRPDGAGGLVHDEGTGQVEVVSLRYLGKNNVQYTSAAAGCVSFSGSSPSLFGGVVNYTFSGVESASTYGCLATDYQGVRAPGHDISPGKVSAASQECPASIDPLNPANSIPAGAPLGVDGKCPTGRYTGPLSDDQAADKRLLGPVERVLPQFLDELDRGVAPQPDSGPGTLTGPGTVAQPGTVTTTGPSGTTTTNTPPWSVTYGGNQFTWNTSTTIINNDGSTTTTTAPPEIKTCGLPNTPACKIDENGTPTYKKDTASEDAVKGRQAAEATKRDSDLATIVDPGWGWFTAPPLVECSGFDWPVGGVTLDPCPGMGVARDIMAYLWAAFGAWWSFGLVRKTLNGG